GGKAAHAPAPLVLRVFRIAQGGAVINGEVADLPPDAAGAVPTIAGDPMADPCDATEFLDVDVQQVARPLALVPLDGSGRLERPQAREPLPAKQAADGRAAQR